MEQVNRIRIKTKDGDELSIVQARHHGQGICGGSKEGTVEVMDMNGYGAIEGYQSLEDLYQLIGHFLEYKSIPADDKAEEEMREMIAEYVE